MFDDRSFIMTSIWTDNQKKAIDTIEKNMQIIACAGSGKTSTMVQHILRLLCEEDVNPENIVAITYTEKAAASLKQKIFDEYNKIYNSLEGLANMYIGTIHGFCLHMLQEFSDDYKTYETLNEVQTKLFIKKFRKDNGIMDVIYHPANGQPYPLLNIRSRSDRVAKAVTAYKTFLDIGREYGKEKLNSELQKHIEKYEVTLANKNYFDFTSIISTTLDRLVNGDFDKDVVGKIKYLIVDEYQDVNEAQEKIIRYFSDKGAYICVVGDDDQTIYQWRGSNLEYIKNFSANYKDVEKIDLDINFRSSNGITEISKQVINQNRNRISKDMRSNQSQSYESGDIITYEFEDRQSEVDFIIKKIKQLLGIKYVRKGIEFKLELDDMVILVSSVKKIPELISALEENHIDFIVEGTKNLFESDEIKVLCDTLSIIFSSVGVQPDKEQIKNRILSNGIPEDVLIKWKRYSPLKDSQIQKAIYDFAMSPLVVDDYEYTIQGAIRDLFTNLQLFTVKEEKVLYNWGKFTEMINDFEKIYLDIAPIFRLKLLETFLSQDAPEIYPEGWLSPDFKAVKCLRIMTLHQSKGLEYPVVFMPFLTKFSIFPQRNPGGTNAWGIINDDTIKRRYADNDEGIRRIFYVGMTRSEKFLFLTRSNCWSETGKTFYSEPAFPFIEAKNSPFKETKLYFDKIYDKSEKTKFSNDEVITLNFSLLKDLFDCPYKFKMTNIYGFCSPLNIRMGYGRSIHNMLDFIHKNYSHLDLNNPETVDRIVKKYLYLPYGSPKLYEAMTDKARRNLRSYISNNASRFQYIKFSEKSIDFSIDEYMFINGRIDLVRDEVNHTITLVDFKSSSEVLSKDQIRNQLMVYVLGYESLTGEKVDYIESYDFNNSNPTTIELENDDRERFQKRLVECEQTIRNNTYKKAYEIDLKKDKEFCKSIQCEFFNSCHK